MIKNRIIAISSFQTKDVHPSPKMRIKSKISLLNAFTKCI